MRHQRSTIVLLGVYLGLTPGACSTTPKATPSSVSGTRFPDAGQISIMMDGDSLPRPARIGGGPAYPVSQRHARVTGQLVAVFVIDGSGRVEEPSIAFVEPAPHPDFHKSVCAFLRDARFVPARDGGIPQRTLVYMPFRFWLSTAAPLGPPPNVKRHQTRARAMAREDLVAELEKHPHC